MTIGRVACGFDSSSSRNAPAPPGPISTFCSVDAKTKGSLMNILAKPTRNLPRVMDRRLPPEALTVSI